MKSLLLAPILTLCLLTSSGAQTKAATSPEDAKRIGEGILAALAASNPNGAVSTMQPYTVVPASDFDVFKAQFLGQQDKLIGQFGLPSGYEFIRSDNVGTRLVRHTFLVFYDKAPIRWSFVFYKAASGWVLTHFNFEGNASTFFSQ